MKRKYNKNINLDYQFENTPESEQVLEEVFGKILSNIVQEQKRLRAYFKSDSYKKQYKYLSKKRSVLVDFLSIH